MLDAKTRVYIGIRIWLWEFNKQINKRRKVLFKLVSKEEIVFKEIANKLKKLNEHNRMVRIMKNCMLKYVSVNVRINELKEECVELLVKGEIDKGIVKSIFNAKFENIVWHRCTICDRSEYDVVHDVEEHDAEDIWNDIWNEYLDYCNNNFDIDYDD